MGERSQEQSFEKAGFSSRKNIVGSHTHARAGGSLSKEGQRWRHPLRMGGWPTQVVLLPKSMPRRRASTSPRSLLGSRNRHARRTKKLPIRGECRPINSSCLLAGRCCCPLRLSSPTRQSSRSPAEEAVHHHHHHHHHHRHCFQFDGLLTSCLFLTDALSQRHGRQ